MVFHRAEAFHFSGHHLYFLLSSCSVFLCFTFRSVVHLELMITKGVRSVLRSNFWHMNDQFF
jgi:hypothetical protein